MRQYSEILKQHADCSVRTMETGDHFKNGASPKSQTSKRNHLKKFNLLLLAALCFCAFTNKANAAWTGDGDGTTGDPWQIGDGETNTAPAVKAKLVGSALTVFGTGNMADFWDSTDGEAPWHSVSSNITTVVIESGVTNIGDVAFWDCTNLTSITIQGNITRIGKRAFEKCSKLVSIIIPNTVNEVECEAFLNCSSLKTVTIENGTGTLAFIRSLYNTDHKYHDDWFKNCPIETLHLHRNYSGESFKGITTLSSLIIGENVTSIGIRAFEGCSGLATVTLEDGAKILTFEMDDYAHSSNGAHRTFTNCPITSLHFGRNISYKSSYSPFSNNDSLTSLTIGNSVATIGQYAFSGCSALAEINSKNPTPPTVTVVNNSDSFKGVSRTACTLSVPAGSLSDYKAAPVWKEFFSEEGGNTTVAPTGVTLEPTTTSLSVGNTQQLTATVLPANATNNAVTWSSDNNTVATVSETGVVTAKVDGTANITVTTVDGNKTATCAVTVVPNPTTPTCTTPPNYNNALPTPTTSWQTRLGSIVSGGCYVYQVSVTSGQKYTFKTGCGDGATADFDTELFVYDSSGNQLTSDDDGCESNRSKIENYQFNYNGYAYIRVKGHGPLGGTTAYGSYTLAYQKVSDGAGVEEVVSQQITVYPNPAKDEIFIKSESRIKKVEIYSLTGSLLLFENNFNEKISMRNFAAGVYLVKIYTDKDLVIRKVVKK